MQVFARISLLERLNLHGRVFDIVRIVQQTPHCRPDREVVDIWFAHYVHSEGRLL